MKNIDWNDLNYFLATVQSGSMAAAAKLLKVNHTTVSRRISALEQQLAAPLFERTATGLSITPLGESMIPYAENMRESVNAMDRLVTADKQELAGTIKVTAIDMFGRRVLAPVLKEFLDLHPHIDLELILQDENLDLGAREADLAFRATDNPAPDLVGKRLGRFAMTVYCTEDVWQQYQQEPQSICAIDWTENGPNTPDWVEEYMPGLKVRHYCSTINGIYELARAGCGMARLPCGLGDTTPELIRVPGIPLYQGMGLWVLSHIDLRNTARIKALRDFVVDRLEKELPLMEGQCEKHWQTLERHREL
ncbi:LysR family transcriptional regulator [uncultured Pseudoteredinibacter sp.]|uniref:LysR family transcriptional regulator n=1 Tax=uncultured Pseudoteredinibacter sp. TaxID=1641701 RepID=UPI0026386661|nr:LysR family transcriptional regulator [uncultured Pseudoteredinibacter sp.]